MYHILNWKLILYLFSRISLIISAALILSAVVGLIYNENIGPFIISSVITGVTGFTLYLGTKNHKEESLKRKEAFFMVALSWFSVSIMGSLPYIISGSIPSLTDAYFESASGFTTTGSSILTDIEALPYSILFWRSLTHWIGGIGIIVLFIIIMPTLHEGGYHLFTLESSFQEKIQPKIKSVGLRLAYIYLSLTLMEIIMLLAGGMNLFESVCHAFGTIATGGFSPKNSSIGGYPAYIQYVVMIFMLLSGTNFIIHYYMIKKSYNKIRNNEEVKFYYGLVLFTGSLITFIIYLTGDKSFEQSFRDSFFQVISIITCTGFASSDYLLWPSFACIIIFFSMFFGGSTGSTAGGIKIARLVLVIKNVNRLFRENLHPKAVFSLNLNGKSINESVNNSILTFVALYLIIFITGTIFLVFSGLDGLSSASAAATAMAGIGPGFGSVGPASNFAHLSDIAKFIMTVLMILGRLEIFTVLTLFSGKFWKE